MCDFGAKKTDQPAAPAWRFPSLCICIFSINLLRILQLYSCIENNMNTIVKGHKKKTNTKIQKIQKNTQNALEHTEQNI